MSRSMTFCRQARQLPRGAVLLQPHHHQPILLARHFAASGPTPPTEEQDNLGDDDEISTIKSKIRKALRDRKDDVTLKHVNEFFNLKSVTLFDCNKIIKSCWLNSNAKVAKFTWKAMRDRHIDLNAFSVACLLMALSKGGYLDEALDLLKQLGRKIKDVQPHIIFCGIFLNGCSLTGSAFYAEKCLQFIKESALQEDELVYLELMKLAGKRKDLPAVQKAWTLMVKTCKPSIPTLDSYCAAVKALCQVGAFNEALVALREMVQMVSKNENFTLISEKKMKIKFFTKEEGPGKKEEISGKRQTGEGIAIDDFIRGDTESLDNTSGVDQFRELPEEDSLYTEESESASKLPHAQLLGWTQLAMLNMEQTEMDNLPESLQSVGNPISGFFSDKFDKVKILLRHAFNAIINTAVQKGDLQSAELLFSQMRAVNLKPDRYSYNAMLRAVVRGRGLEQGFQVIENMVKNGLEPDTKSYNAILEGFCSNLELDKAEALLDRMLNSDSYKPSDFSFNVLLKACADLDDLKRALRVFTKMVEARVKPDQRTILYLLTAFGRVNAYYEKGTEDSQKELSHRLSAIESYMEYANLSHSLQTFNAMLVALSAEGMADEVIQRLRLAEGYVDERGIFLLDAITFNTAMNACIQTGQWDAALEIFERMSKVGLKANTDTYNVLINGCAERQTIEDAMHFWDTMLEDGLKPNLLTYNSLIKVYCYSDDLDGAVNILTDMDEGGIQPDAVTYVTLLASSCKRERLDMVEFLVEHMHRQNIEPNITVCEHVVMAYLNCHQVDDAAEALRVLSIRMLPKGGELREQMEDVLKHIFSEDSLEVESSTLHLLKDVLVNKGLVSEALFAARLSGFGSTFVGAWNADESPWARRLSCQYAPGDEQ